MKGDIVREAKQGIPTPLLDGCHVLNVIFTVKTAAITLMNGSFDVYALMYISITLFIYTFLLTPIVFNGFDLTDFDYHIRYAQKSPSNAHAHIAIWARGLNFYLSLHLHPYIVYMSSQGSGECIGAGLSEPSLLENAICTKILCAGSMIVFAGESGASTGVRTRCCNLV